MRLFQGLRVPRTATGDCKGGAIARKGGGRQGGGGQGVREPRQRISDAGGLLQGRRVPRAATGREIADARGI